MKYIDVTPSQFRKYQEQLHKHIHWLLVSKERKDENLDERFKFTLFTLGGLNSLLFYPEEVIEICVLIESARLENLKDECDWKLYRKAILDAHSLIDKIQYNPTGGDADGYKGS